MNTAQAQRGIGSVYGTSRDQPFDRWFRYPAGFSPDARRLAASAVEVTRGAIVDPFCGSAAGAGRVSPRSIVGIEAHPLIADLAATKFAEPPGPGDGLRKAAARLATAAEEASFDAGAESPLVVRSFQPAVLEHLARLRDTLAAQPRGRWRRYLRWALLGTLRDVASVNVGWPYQRPGVDRAPVYGDATARFLARAEMIAADLDSTGGRPRGRVVRGDARAAATWRRAARGAPFGACITSPPYLNNFDYADATRLELYFLGTVSSWAEMCGEVRAGMIVATTQQSRRHRAHLARAALERRGDVGREIGKLTERLVVERARRDRGKEYDQVVPSYFADLVRVLRHLHAHTAPGARAAWVVGDSAPYGVYVDTPRLVGALAADVGFKLLDDVVVRSRGLRWRTNGSRHQVPLTERLVTFTRSK